MLSIWQVPCCSQENILAEFHIDCSSTKSSSTSSQIQCLQWIHVSFAANIQHTSSNQSICLPLLVALVRGRWTQREPGVLFPYLDDSHQDHDNHMIWAHPVRSLPEILHHEPSRQKLKEELVYYFCRFETGPIFGVSADLVLLFFPHVFTNISEHLWSQLCLWNKEEQKPKTTYNSFS